MLLAYPKLGGLHLHRIVPTVRAWVFQQRCRTDEDTIDHDGIDDQAVDAIDVRE
jgi:hypothetical protein